MARVQSSVAKDSAHNFIAAAAPIPFTLVVTPFYLAAVGAERFGILAICWTIATALRFASLGMGPALTYRLALMEHAEPSHRSRLAWTALALSLAASLVGALLVFGSGELYFRYIFSSASTGRSEVREALPLLAALFPLNILSAVLGGALQGCRRFGLLAYTAVLSAALVSILPLIAAYVLGPQIWNLMAAMVAASAVILVAQFAICMRVVPLAIPPEVDAADAKTLLGYGAWMSVTAFVAPLVLVFDRFVIGALRGPAAVAAYVLPYNVVQSSLCIPASVSNAILPRFAPMAEGSEVQDMQSQSLAWLGAILTPMTIAAIALAAPFFRFWIGPELGSVAAPVAVILLVGSWVHGIGHIPSAIVVARGRPDLLAKLLLAYLLPYAALLYFLTLWFGIIGAAVAWSIRAAFDPLLFAATRPYAADMWRVSLSAALVLAAMAVALVLPWSSGLYWVACGLLLILGCYLHRGVLISSFAMFALRHRFGPRPCGPA